MKRTLTLKEDYKSISCSSVSTVLLLKVIYGEVLLILLWLARCYTVTRKIILIQMCSSIAKMQV